MTVSEYNSLSISTDSWFCKNCILPNFTDSYFETNNKTTNDCESNTPEFDYVPLTPNTSAVNIEFETDVNNDIFTELKEVRKRHQSTST
jgi:Asp/Glu/hydantoin racemase